MKFLGKPQILASFIVKECAVFMLTFASRSTCLALNTNGSLECSTSSSHSGSVTRNVFKLQHSPLNIKGKFYEWIRSLIDWKRLFILILSCILWWCGFLWHCQWHGSKFSTCVAGWHNQWDIERLYCILANSTNTEVSVSPYSPMCH